MEKSSEVYRRNNNGPKTLPCGTPDITQRFVTLKKIHSTKPCAAFPHAKVFDSCEHLIILHSWRKGRIDFLCQSEIFTDD